MKDKLPHEKGFHVSWDQIHRDSRALAWRLENKGPENGHWKGLIAITRGVRHVTYDCIPVKVATNALGARSSVRRP